VAVRPGIPAFPKCLDVVLNDFARHRETGVAVVNRI